jgi:hypothetical protein
MPATMQLKTPGKLNSPPSQAEFDKLPVAGWCGPHFGVFYRLHGMDSNTGKAWHPIYFSRAGRTRFDPIDGPGTFYVGETLLGVMMEVFDDMWGPVGSITRSLTRAQLAEWWVTLVAVPQVIAFEAHKGNLSKMGTDLQLLAGEHSISREWASRLAHHPVQLDGIYYGSRHDSGQCNLAIFNQRPWKGEQSDASLTPPAAGHASRSIGKKDPLIYGPPVMLRDHPELHPSLVELEVAILP